MRGFVSHTLGTVGKRVYAAILLVAILYLGLHLFIGVRLVLTTITDAPFVALAISVTLITALAGTLQISENLVFATILAWRGPRRLVAPPPTIADERLPLVIVQIPGRNEPLVEVQRSIDSVLAASYPVTHLLVQHIDNSDDERWQDIVNAYREEPRVSVLHRDGTAGFKAGNLNSGLRAIESRHYEDPAQVCVGLLDVGDTFAEKTLRLLATEFVHDPGLGFVQALTRVRNPNDTLITKAESYITNAWWRYYQGMQCHYGMPAIYGHHTLVRLESLLKVGGWEETKVAEDWATGNKILLAMWEGKWVDYATTDPSVISGEMVPPTLEGQQKQKSKWATGGSELAKTYGHWMKAPLPWNYRFDLLIRLASHPTAALRFLGALTLPLWVALAAVHGENRPALHFGLLSASLQSAWLIHRVACSGNYLRERDLKSAIGMLVCLPIQMMYTMPIVPHMMRGVYKGLRYTLNAFVVSPKRNERYRGVMQIVANQRLALGMAAFLGIPAIAVLSTGLPGYVRLAAVTCLVSAGMTTMGVLLVPVTQWLRHWLHQPRHDKGEVE